MVESLGSRRRPPWAGSSQRRNDTAIRFDTLFKKQTDVRKYD